jgi:hypothetical protein
MSGITTALVRASQTITLDSAAEATDAETIVIGSKTYTFKATVGTDDGAVHIGAAVADTVDNLVAAINLDPSEGETGVEGTDYGANMTRNPDCYATRVVSTGVITLYAHVPGSIGNHIPLGQGTSTITLGGATFASGTGIIGDFFDEFFDSVQINSEVIAHLRPFSAVEGGKLD